ncbi:disulfide isomerase [Niveomyces insectorum RCEF 264]|uniref:Disulfide isomerase n=1 Tax=Niveomyces insectorum RCEF 264 TaxID=1081102 RepID=A0A167QYB3_9HYPO|nr:disulfide isomerase [Niveomyces insectorum RCEF 264]
MKLPPFSSLLGVFALGSVVATAAAAAESSQGDAKPTTFDGIEVPPLLQLTPKNFDDYLKKTKPSCSQHLIVSPYCHHCKRFAPAFQTTYEFYYTEKDESKPGVKFSDIYDMQFAEINCVAYFDLCHKLGIESYPTTILFADGEKSNTIRGVKNVTILSRAIEAALDKAHPAVRPTKLLLPKDGDTARPRTEADADAILDKNADREKGEKKQADKAKADAEKKAKTAKDANSSPSEKVVAAKDVAAKDATAKNAPAAGAKEHNPSHTGSASSASHRGPSPSTPNPNTNPSGTSVPLTAETFQTLVTMTQEPWFIKFYAPWCHHCKAMAASWEQLAKEMQGRLNVGEVNCEKETRLCKDVRLQGYPTILFFRGGERVEYDGLRGLGDFVQYAEKALDIVGGVRDVDAAAFKALEEQEEVIFLYFYDFATTTEDFLALERLPLSLIGRAKLVKTDDPALYERFKITTWPRLLVSREGRPTYYAPLTPHEMRDAHRVLRWMKSVWLPIVPELTATNAREIMDGKLVVLGILKRADTEAFASATREMKSAASEWMDKQLQLFQLERQELRDAKQLRIEEAEDRNDQRALRAAKSIRVNMDRADKKEVAFAWVDGVFWQRWVRTTYGIDVKDGERVIINDEDNRRYWDTTITGNPILPSRTSILETLNKVTVSPAKIKPKLTISSIEKLFFDIRATFSEHPFLSIGCVLGLSLGAASWLRGRVRRGRGHFRLEDSNGGGGGGMKEYKLPILGSGLNANGKVD